MKAGILAVIVAVALPSEVRLQPDLAPTPANETKLGAGVSLKDATPVALLLEQPENFVGKSIRIDGVATAVCSAMGCWMAVAADNDPKGPTVRLKVDWSRSSLW